MPFFTKSVAASTQAAENTFGNTSERDGDVPYFPPPPTYAESKKKPSSILKPPPLSKSTTPLPKKARSTKRNNSRHNIGYPTQARRKRLQEVHLRPIDLSPRHWILVALLLLSFIVVILGFISAECVVMPHTLQPAANSTDDYPVEGLGLYIRQLPSSPEPPSIPLGATPSAQPGNSNAQSSQNTASSPGPVAPGGTTAAPQPNTTSSDQYMADEGKRLGYDSPKNLLILFCYTFTLPLATMIQTITEMLFLCCAKRPAESDADDEDSDTDSITKLKTLALTKKHKPHMATNPKLHPFLPYLPAISLTFSLLLLAGWITINTIQIHCEIPISPQLQTPISQKICPVQTRGHFMRGIHEVSIVKNVFGWVVVAVYMVYVAWCVRVHGLLWRATREQSNERKRIREMEGQRTEQLRRSVVRFRNADDVSEARVMADEKKGARVQINEV